jgi:hypothetical protein
VYVCAIRHGTGLKSKMLEAMAMRLPIVGYPGAIVGLEGSAPASNTSSRRIRRSFAAQRRVLAEGPPARADRMAPAGRDLVEEKYSWSRARVSTKSCTNRSSKSARAGNSPSAPNSGGRKHHELEGSAGTGHGWCVVHRSHIVENLVERGAAVRVVDDLSSGHLDNIKEHVERGRVEFIRADLKEAGTAQKAVDGMSTVFTSPLTTAGADTSSSTSRPAR